MPDLTPTVDTVGDRVVAQFPSGAFVTVSASGEIELLGGYQHPSRAEGLALAWVLIKAGDRSRASVVLKRTAQGWVW